MPEIATPSPSQVESDLVEEGSNPSSAMEKRVAAVEAQAIEGRVIARMMADPDIRAVYDARRQGRKIHLVDDDTYSSLTKKGEPEVDPTPVDLDALSPTELASHLEKRVLSGVEKRVNALLNPMMGRLDGITSVLQQDKTSKLAGEIATIRAKSPDFDNFRDDMLALSEKYVDMPVDELYMLARKRRGVPPVASTGTMSERPTTQSARPPIKRVNDSQFRGTSGFRELLNAALGSPTPTPGDESSEG